jgi:phage terminase large subunit GpA-like protein
MSYNYLFSLIEGITPPRLVSVDEWSAERRIVPNYSPEPGRWRNERTPYLSKIMYELSPQSPTEEVVVIKGTQLGFTEVGINTILCYMDLYPCPIMMILPNNTLAKRTSDKRITPSILAMPKLLAKVKDAKSKGDGGGSETKEFLGGALYMGWSFSDSTTASTSVRLLIFDDVDRFSSENAGEGDFIETGKNRTDAMAGSKIYMNSTPKSKQESRITPEYEASTQAHYYVPCPHCTPKDKNKQKKSNMMLFEENTLKYNRDELGELDGDAWMECPNCKKKIEHHEKTWMMSKEAGAEWIEHKPGKIRKGFRLPSYYSPVGWVSWNKLAMELIAAYKALKEGNNALLKTYRNTRDGIAWEEVINAKDANELGGLLSAYKPWEVPSSTAFLSMSVDVQLDHFWVDVFVHQYGASSHSIRHHRVETWVDVEDVMRMPYYDKDGLIYMVRSCAVDSGYKKDEVYEFCGMNSDIAFPVKGATHPMPNPWKVTSLDNGLKLYVIDTEYFKDMFWAKVERTVEAVEKGNLNDGLFFCHKESDNAYFSQIASEHKKESIDKKGRKKFGWQKRRAKIDNHLFDTSVYNTFVGELAGIRFLSPISEVKRVKRKKHKQDEYDYSSKF